MADDASATLSAKNTSHLGTGGIPCCPARRGELLNLCEQGVVPTHAFRGDLCEERSDERPIDPVLVVVGQSGGARFRPGHTSMVHDARQRALPVVRAIVLPDAPARTAGPSHEPELRARFLA